MDYFDDRLRGFGVRVSTSSKTFFAQCRVRERKNAKGHPLEIKETIGKFGIMSFEDAVIAVKQILDDAAKGITPEDRKNEREHLRKIEESKDVTLGQLFNEYLCVKKDLKPGTLANYQLCMDTYIPDWKNLPARQIDAKMVIERHAYIGDNRSKAMADCCMKVVRAVYNYALEAYEDVILKNPVRKLSTTEAWYHVPARKTYIKALDLGNWFKAVWNMPNRVHSVYLLLLLFTGARKTETAKLHWSDIDLEQGTGLFRYTKNGEPLEVPICGYMLKVLKAYKKENCTVGEKYVFAANNKVGHIVDIRKSILTVVDYANISFTPHDLRRGFITYANNKLKLPKSTQKRLVNHAIPKDVTENYVQFEIEELRTDIEALADYIFKSAGILYGGRFKSAILIMKAERTKFCHLDALRVRRSHTEEIINTMETLNK